MWLSGDMGVTMPRHRGLLDVQVGKGKRLFSVGLTLHLLFIVNAELFERVDSDKNMPCYCIAATLVLGVPHPNVVCSNVASFSWRSSVLSATPS